jgi:hypothetical protein
MKTQTTSINFIFLFFIVTSVFAQDLPTLTKSDLLTTSDLKNKSGWISLKLDLKFQEVTTSDYKYEYYEFVNKKGQYNSSYATNTPFPKNAASVIYKPNTAGAKLLDGVVSFYNNKNEVYLQYLFKSGFIIKSYEFFGGQLKTVVEYLPKLTTVEMYANYYGKDGKIEDDSHEFNDGSKYTTLDGNKNIDTTPLN